jgi:hypothetical protein
LPTDIIEQALERGAAKARRLGLSAALCLQGRWRLEHDQRSSGRVVARIA